jgi:hypothetical protein
MQKLKANIRLAKDSVVKRTVTIYYEGRSIMPVAQINNKLHLLTRIDNETFKPLRPITYDELLRINPYLKWKTTEK